VADAARSDRATIRDLVALTALPGLWSNQGVSGIATALAEATLSMLRLDAVCVRAAAAGEPPYDVARCALPDAIATEVATRLAAWLDGQRGRGSGELAVPLRVAGVPFGIGAEDGALVAASTRPDFPTEHERLLLSVAANLAVVSMRGVRARDRERMATRAAHEATAIVETINRIGQMLAGQHGLKTLVQAVTDEATRLTGAQFGAFFYNVTNEEGESYTLYTLSGVSPEAFAKFPMPRNTALFGPTFRGEGIIRIDDVRKDARYGQHAPYHGMPPGHLPVTSYLAVPVVSRSGEVIGGLFFGHAAPGMFSERMETIMVGVSAQTAIAIDNVRLFEKEQRARAMAETASRAKDDFLAVLSHELRTPLNAVYGWARMLAAGRLDAEATARAIDVITRNARAQMQLIDDMLDVARIAAGKLRLDVRPVDLVEVIGAALDAVRPAADAKGVRLQSTLDPRAVGILNRAGFCGGSNP
jgi:GAF domain-containing protein